MSYDPTQMSDFKVPDVLGGPDSLSSLPNYQHPASSAEGAAAATSSTAAVQPQAPGAPGPAPTAPRIRRRNRMITSCLECRRRKLKCDKSHPCTNCQKFARDCVFLAPALDTASQLKLTEIKEKMGSLERVLEQDVARNGAWREVRSRNYNGPSIEEEIDFAPIPEDEKELEPTPLAVVDAVYDDDADDDLLDLGVAFGKLRMTDRIGGFFRPKISDELTVSLTDQRNDRRSDSEKALSPQPQVHVMPRPANFMAPGPSYIPPSNFFFASNAYGNSLIDYLPSQHAADHLLSQYWHAVHPICRIVHRPSFQRRYDQFWDEVRMGVEPIGSLQALVFAAMFSGVVSMPEELILRDFAVPKKDLVENFQQGTETALSRAKLLSTTKVETMQAFVMYMIPLCRDQMSRAHSALVGTAIRLAECMGLHKDPTIYGMGPVETHVRRMVWYQLCILDIRTCEAQGPRPGIRETEFDTKLPLNVNDDDLESENPPRRSSPGWTDMTATLIRTECNEMHRQIWFDRPRLEKKQISLTAVLGKIENFRKIMNEKYQPILDDNIPLQQATRLMLTILTSRMHIMVLHRYHNSVSFKIPDRLRQIILTSGTEMVETAMAFETLPSIRHWAWFAGALNQYQTAFLLLAEVFSYPMRREADRIWRVLDYVFEPPPHLSRDEKSRLILTEIRDRMGIYRDARKLRAPVLMNKRMGIKPPVQRGEIGLQDEQEDKKPDLMYPSARGEKTHPEMVAIANEQEAQAQQAQAQTRRESGSPETGRSGSISGTVGSGQDIAMPDDLMADIDWKEWDKLFPPDVNTGELNIPMSMPMSGPPIPTMM